MHTGYTGCEVPKLGFGMMRLPMDGNEIDLAQTCRMTDAFIDAGFNYFDVAWGYLDGRCEGILKKAVIDRYPRESVRVATKFPVWVLKEQEDVERTFRTQLERTGAGYFDYYLLHAIGRDRLETLDKFDMWGFLKRIKKEGLAKHVGMSFHDTADVLEDILKNHPELEFVQLQINYIDWEDEGVQSRKCYEVCRKYGRSVIIMEPVKGGTLAALPENAAKELHALRADASVASWALRFAASLDGLITVLSGMSNDEQMADNIKTMRDFEPLSYKEMGAIDRVVSILRSQPSIPCTDCRYCMEDCPQHIGISRMFGLYNRFLRYENLEGAKADYARMTQEHPKASECLRCGACEARCPQRIPIIANLEKIASTLE
ncbi:MAG: aldo/keto reductase [Christensenellales bacterium]